VLFESPSVWSFAGSNRCVVHKRLLVLMRGKKKESMLDID
jgi:hypothetical protein